MQTTDPIDDARTFGRLEADRLDGELRLREGQAREERLSRLVLGAGDMEAVADSGVSSSTAHRLQAEIERLAKFNSSILRSRGWRLLQALRRPFGRAW